jgi:hypothetical protein
MYNIEDLLLPRIKVTNTPMKLIDLQGVILRWVKDGVEDEPLCKGYLCPDGELTCNSCALDRTKAIEILQLIKKSNIQKLKDIYNG